MNTLQALNKPVSPQFRAFCELQTAGDHSEHPPPTRIGEKSHDELKLFACAMSGDLESVKELVGSGVDVNALSAVSNSSICGRFGQNTALMFAVAARKNAVVAFLLKHGADPSICNLAGDTAHTIALRNNDHEIAGLFPRRYVTFGA
ncbi:MAG: ankyrin repeat domain-containing protein [Sulfuricella sp.]|nr:ankyrin repeat domain-containing protein [Sulfuricella sp.]